MRTLAATALALYAAFFFQLENAGSAAVTVAIVANPLPGAVFSKSIWRIGGTIIGAAMGLLFMAAFPQAPILFLFAFGLWIGLCTYVSSMLRHFQSYGAILAGYTLAIVSTPAIDDPYHIFDLVFARVAVVVVGIVATALVSGLFTRRFAAHGLDMAIGKIVEETASFCVAAFDPQAHPDLERPRVALLQKIDAIDEQIDFAAAESIDIGLRVAATRQSMALLSSAVSAVERVGVILDTLTHRDDGDVFLSVRADILAVVSHLRGSAMPTEPTMRDLKKQVVQLQSYADAEWASRARDFLPAFIVMDLLYEFLDQLDDGVTGLLSYRSGPIKKRAHRILPFYQDPYAATVNACRAAITIWLAAAFGIVTAWPTAPLLLLIVTLVCTLLSARDHPAAVSLFFLKGGALACLVSFVCVFFVLPLLDGFPLLIAAIAPVVMGGAYMTMSPKPQRAVMAAAFMIFFPVMTNYANPIVYDVVTFLNNAFALVIGISVSALAYIVVLPTSAARARTSTVRLIRKGVERLGLGGSRADQRSWERRQLFYTARLAMRAGADEAVSHLLQSGAQDALQIGRIVYRMQAAIADPRLPAELRQASRVALHGLADLHDRPEQVALAMEQTAERFLAAREVTPAAAERSLAIGHAGFHRICALIRQSAGFFQWPHRMEEAA